MPGSNVEVPVVAVSLPDLLSFFFPGWLRRVRGFWYPCCHPLTSRCIWQVLDPRVRWLHSSGLRALQELSVCGATSLLFFPPRYWCRPESCATHSAELYYTELSSTGCQNRHSTFVCNQRHSFEVLESHTDLIGLIITTKNNPKPLNIWTLVPYNDVVPVEGF